MASKTTQPSLQMDSITTMSEGNDPLMILLPILIVLSSLLFLLLLFLVCVVVMRKRRGIALSDTDGPVDLSHDEVAEGAGGFTGVESRWLESVDEGSRTQYQRAKDFQMQHPPNSWPTDITLSQFLSIQEKGVSAWCFDPDYEATPSVLVHARTELTFLPDPLTPTTVQSNLPIPKLNEVYYWEVKMFDLPPATNVSIGLGTKPYPPFRMPGHSRFSVAYHSNGDKSYNYPFTSTQFGPPLKEGDVLGVGYRPRSGTVFFTRNGRKTEDAFIGLSKWNLFPSLGADGPCSLHVNLGQAGFVHIEAQVKKWGLAPSVGTLAPPPAYGSERDSILLQRGGAGDAQAMPARRRSPPPPIDDSGIASSSNSASSSRRSARRQHPMNPRQSSSMRVITRRRRQSHPDPISEEDLNEARNGTRPLGRYISPTDVEYHSRSRRRFAEEGDELDEEEEWQTESEGTSRSEPRVLFERESSPARHHALSSTLSVHTSAPLQASSSSPEQPANPPTPHVSDIRLHDLHSDLRPPSLPSPTPLPSGISPPEYTIVDPARYPDGVTVEIPPEILAAALEDRRPSSSSRR